jgi:hypothetical protein
MAGLCLVLMIGCSKKTVKNTAPTRDDSAGAKPAPPAPTDRNKRTDKDRNDKNEANWLTDPRFKKDQPKFDPDQVPGQPEAPSGPNATGKQPWGIVPPAGGWQGPVPSVHPNPMGAPAGPGANPMFPPGGLPPLAPGANPPLAPGVGAAPGVGKLQPNVVPGNPPALAPGAGTPIGAAKKAVAQADMRDIQIYVHDSSLVSGKMPSPGEVYAALVKAGSPAAEHLKSGAIILTGSPDRDSVWAYETRALMQGGLVVSQNGVETLTAAELKQRLGR